MTSHGLPTCLAIAAFAAVPAIASAQFTTIPLNTTPIPNSNLRAYTAGNNYPIAPTTLTIGGVPFDLSPLAGTPNSLGVAQTLNTALQFSLSTNVFGVSKVYTLMNSGWGQNGAQNGRLEFYGTNGAFASFNLVQGINIRDHWTAYNQVITDPTIVTTNFGGGTRLDRQTFTLPSSFLTETLTEVRLVATNPGNPQGAVFLAAATVEVPVPACDSIDFNGDGLFPDTADIDDFLSVFSGGPCSTGACGDVDFNNDGLFPDTLDIDSLLSVFSGGACL